MKQEEARRKIQLLRKVTPENGSSPAEAANAASIARHLMERFSIDADDLRPFKTTAHRLSWVYWEQLLDEFGMNLRHFGKRGSAPLGPKQMLLIRLDTGQWWIQQSSGCGWVVLTQEFGLESLRAYLTRHVRAAYFQVRR